MVDQSAVLKDSIVKNIISENLYSAHKSTSIF